MFGLFILLVSSINVNVPGYYTTEVYNTGSTIDFNLTFFKNYNYYIAFCKYPDSLTINDHQLTSRIYKIENLGASLNISVSSPSTLSFGVFQVPSKVYSLEFLILPPETSSYSIVNKNLGEENYYLLILNDNLIDIKISQEVNDTNIIQYSVSGDLHDSKDNNSSIPKTKIIAIKYTHIFHRVSNTTYLISTNANNNTFYGFDSRYHSLLFNESIRVEEIPDNDVVTIVYGHHHYSLSSENPLTIKIPNGTALVFTRSLYVTGVAKTYGESLNILGSSNITAIQFAIKGSLTLATYKSNADCDFIVYNVSNVYCYNYIVISGSMKYKINISNSMHYYCVFSAFTTGKSIISPDHDFVHQSINTNGKMNYYDTSSTMKVYEPVITRVANSYHENDIVTIKNLAASTDENYVIDGNVSFNAFYEIDGYLVNKLNDYTYGVMNKPNYEVIFGGVLLAVGFIIFVGIVFFTNPKRKSKIADSSLDVALLNPDLDEKNGNSKPIRKPSQKNQKLNSKPKENVSKQTKQNNPYSPSSTIQHIYSAPPSKEDYDNPYD